MLALLLGRLAAGLVLALAAGGGGGGEAAAEAAAEVAATEVDEALAGLTCVIT